MPNAGSYERGHKWCYRTQRRSLKTPSEKRDDQENAFAGLIMRPYDPQSMKASAISAPRKFLEST